MPLAGPAGLPTVPHMEIALPVSVDLTDPDLAADVTSHIESVLGWQAMAPGPHLPVRLRLADAPDPGGPPTVVIRRGAGGPDIRDAVRAGALDVLTWPDDAARLTDLVPPPVAVRPARRVLVVAGAAAGVGTSTVALALGALHAWTGQRVLVLTDRSGLQLAGVDRAEAAGGGSIEVPGVPRLRLGTDLPGPTGATEGCGDLDVLVADGGTTSRATILVGRPDGRLLRALTAPTTTAAVVVTVGEGALHPAELARVIGDRDAIALPWSFRVGRAGLRGRVPGALPGRYLAALGPAARTDHRADLDPATAGPTALPPGAAA